MRTLVVAEQAGNSIAPSTRSAVRCAQAIGAPVDLLVCNPGVDGFSEAARGFAGVERVLEVRVASDASRSAEVIAEAALAAHAKVSYSHILFVAASAGKAAMPRVAAKLDVPALSEVASVESPEVFSRFIYAGAVVAKIRNTAPVVVATVRPTAFDPCEANTSPASFETLTCDFKARAFAFESLAQAQSDRIDLLTAERVVAAGRGVGDAEGFAAAGELAKKMGAAIASTRMLVDEEIAPSESQVGQTGKVVAPKLYMAFGISGAIQHIAGMKDSKTIVAVNNDPEAPIFDACDYYLKADALETIRELTAKL